MCLWPLCLVGESMTTKTDVWHASYTLNREVCKMIIVRLKIYNRGQNKLSIYKLYRLFILLYTMMAWPWLLMLTKKEKYFFKVKSLKR